MVRCTGGHSVTHGNKGKALAASVRTVVSAECSLFNGCKGRGTTQWIVRKYDTARSELNHHLTVGVEVESLSAPQSE